jgi:hypothetical protein
MQGFVVHRLSPATPTHVSASVPKCLRDPSRPRNHHSVFCREPSRQKYHRPISRGDPSRPRNYHQISWGEPSRPTKYQQISWCDPSRPRISPPQFLPRPIAPEKLHCICCRIPIATHCRTRSAPSLSKGRGQKFSSSAHPLEPRTKESTPCPRSATPRAKESPWPSNMFMPRDGILLSPLIVRMPRTEKVAQARTSCRIHRHERA